MMVHAGLLFGVAAALFLLGAGCAEDGQTPDCPALPLYDVRVSARRDTLRPELTAAAEAGCITLPNGFLRSSQGDGGSGTGEAGSGGAGGDGAGAGGDGSSR